MDPMAQTALDICNGACMVAVEARNHTLVVNDEMDKIMHRRCK